MDEPIRILNLFTIMNRGGAETMVMNYYRKIDKTKVQFDFMVHRQERGAYDDEIEAMGGHIYRMCPIYPQNIFRYKQLLKDFFDTHPEYRILHSHMSELGYFAFKEAVRHRVPVRICHAHSSPNFAIETWKEKLKVLPREILARGICSLSTDYFVCSYKAGNWLFGKKNADKFVMMKNAIDASLFAYDNNVAVVKKKEMGWEGKTVVGHVGRLIVPKNHVFLLSLFKEFHQVVPNSILALVGDGNQRKILMEKARLLGIDNCVQFLLTRTDTNELYNAFDLFVFPSLYEGLPVSLIEAQSSGLPCIISDTISPQAKLLDTCKVLSLSASYDIWIHAMLAALQQERRNTSLEIRQLGFDITANAEWLTQYYINRFKENA